MCNNKIMKKFYLLFISIMLTLNINAQTNDVGIIKIVEPVLCVCSGSTPQVKVRIKNFGTQTQTSIPLSYYFANPLVPNPTLGIWTGILAAGDSTDFVFPTLLNIPPATSMVITVYADLLNDINRHNDTVYKALAIFVIGGTSFTSGQTNVNIGSIEHYSVMCPNANAYHWTYTPSSSVTINAIGTTAILSFGAGASSGVLSVYGYDTLSNCSGPITTLNISIGTGINEINNKSFLLAQNSPNPASTNTNIEYNLVTAGNVKVELINLLGEKLMLKTFIAEIGKNNFVLDVSGLPNGIYYYSMEFKGKKQFKKLLVSK